MKDIQDTMREALAIEAEELAAFAKNAEYGRMEQAAGLIGNCKGRVFVSGCGTSGAAAQKIAHTLTCINVPAVHLCPAEALHGGLGALQQDDVLILLSKGGKTSEINAMLPTARAKGVHIIAVCDDAASPMAQAAELHLPVLVGREAEPFNMLATCSTLATIAMFDAIIISIKEKNGFTKAQFLQNHPGGAVGKQLQQEV